MVRFTLWNVDRPLKPRKKPRKTPPRPPQEYGVVELQALPRVGEYITFRGILPEAGAFRVIAVFHHAKPLSKDGEERLLWTGVVTDLMHDVYVVRDRDPKQIVNRLHDREEFP